MAQWIGKRRVQDIGDSNEVKLESSNWYVDNVAITATAAELNRVDRSEKITWFTDFLGGAIGDIPEITIKAGSGTGNAVTLSAGLGGRASIVTASDDGAITANASMLEMGGLDWRADSGGLVMETRIQFDVVSTAYCFMGFTDASQASTLEEPIFLTGTDIDSTATDACGVAFDADGTTKTFFHGGVKAGTDTAPVYASGPAINTYYTVRVEVSSAGAVQGFIDGVAIGAPVANAVTATAPLIPIIVVANRSAAAITALVDYLYVECDR